MAHPLQRWMKEAGFRNKAQLAQGVLRRAPTLFAKTDAQARSRRIALQLTRLERGQVTWWKKQQEALQALAALLHVPATRLLEGAAPGELIEFIEFPLLQPLDPRVELPLEGTGWTSSTWNLFTSPLPQGQWLWSQVPPGAGKSLATRIRQVRAEGAEAGVTFLQLRRLAELAPLRLPVRSALFIEVASVDPQTDADALRMLEQHESVVVVASFPRPRSLERPKGPMGQQMQGQEKVPPKKWVELQWSPNPDWRREFADWVARRLPAGQQGFQPEDFSAWLAQMDPEGSLVHTPGELLTLCHLASEVGTDRLARQFARGWRDVGRKVTDKMLQREASGESGRAFWLRAAGAEAVRSLISVALEDITSPWPPSASAEVWAHRLPERYAAPVSDEELDRKLQAIGRAQGTRERQRQIAEAKASLKSLSPLMAIEHLSSTRLLRVQGDGMLGLYPRWMVEALARERIEDALQRASETWGRWAADPGRQHLVDAVLDALPSPKLVSLTKKAVQGFDISVLGAVGAVEALFAAWGRRFDGAPTSFPPEEVVCLHQLVRCQLDSLLQRQALGCWASPVSRPGLGEGSNAWLADCWAWSFSLPVPPGPLEPALGWLFPGWLAPVLSRMEARVMDALEPRDVRHTRRIMARLDVVMDLSVKASPGPVDIPVRLLPAFTFWSIRQGRDLPQPLVEALLRNASHFLEELLQRLQHLEPRAQAAFAGTLFREMARLAQGIGRLMDLVDVGERSFTDEKKAFIPSPLADWLLARVEEEPILKALEEVGAGAAEIPSVRRLPGRIVFHLLRHLLAQKSRKSATMVAWIGVQFNPSRPEHVPVLELFLERGWREGKMGSALWRLAPERAWQRFMEAMEDERTGAWLLVGEELLESMPPSWQVRLLERLETRQPGIQPALLLPWLRRQVRAGGALAERAYTLARRRE